MRIEKNVTYWGNVGKREVNRKVNIIETRTSGTKYVNWTQKKKDGSDGQNSWTELRKFEAWVKGIYEKNPEVTP
ncbi:hypothetical protein [Paenibacillus periandrae]|uniref:hypothetical protein n=1 Tax=Paenibacillus periandrae TaxID=1761741 RepID=UPI001F088F47|nr:hypothetical protein [Paenibacillus periandrae]